MKIFQTINILAIIAAAAMGLGFLLGKITPEQARDYGGGLFCMMIILWALAPKEEA